MCLYMLFIALKIVSPSDYLRTYVMSIYYVLKYILAIKLKQETNEKQPNPLSSKLNFTHKSSPPPPHKNYTFSILQYSNVVIVINNFYIIKSITTYW